MYQLTCLGENLLAILDHVSNITLVSSKNQGFGKSSGQVPESSLYGNKFRYYTNLARNVSKTISGISGSGSVPLADFAQEGARKLLKY